MSLRNALTGYCSVMLVLFFSALSAVWAFASWNENGNVLSAEVGNQCYPQLASDGAGGAIVVWADYLTGSYYDVRAQRVNPSGVIQWTADGVTVCGAPGVQCYPQVVSDGAGGAIIVWQDERATGPADDDIYAQRVDASGAPQWGEDGIPICAASGGQVFPRLVPDGSGGAIVAWSDLRSGSTRDIYAQRVDASGTVLWEPDGVVISRANWDQKDPRLIPDGAGGAVIVWEDGRDQTEDIYAQRVSALGVVHWTEDGIAVCAASEDQVDPCLVSDGASGAIVTWRDERNGEADVYAQRVNASGSVEWVVGGVAVCTAPEVQEGPHITSDGTGGAIVAWRDWRSGTDYDVYAQRVDASGAVRWAWDGVAVCTLAVNQFDLRLIPDGAGGTVLTWSDYRGGTADIYAQRVNTSGLALWPSNGVPICTATGAQQLPQLIPDGTGGAIITWQDNRTAVYDVYVHHVDASGTTDLVFLSASAVDAGFRVVVSWEVAVNVCALDFSIQRSESREGQFVELSVPISRSSEYSFYCIDNSVECGCTYWYRILLTGPFGEEMYGPFAAHVTPVPEAYCLHPCFPNPFNPSCTITYDIPIPGRVELRVFDAKGSVVRTLEAAWKLPGVHSEVWDGKGDDGRELASGVYIYQVVSGDFTASGKVVLLR